MAFGDSALEAFALLGDNQERTSRWSIPQRTADALAGLTGGSAGDIVDYTRTALGLLLIVAVVLLLRAAWRRRTVPGRLDRPGRMGDAGRAAHDRVARALVRDLAAAAGRARRMTGVCSWQASRCALT